MWFPLDSFFQHFKKSNKVQPTHNVPENLGMASLMFTDSLNPYSTVSVSCVHLSWIQLEIDHTSNFFPAPPISKIPPQKKKNERIKISKWYLWITHYLQPRSSWYNFLSTACCAPVTCARMSIYSISFHFDNISICEKKKF